MILNGYAVLDAFLCLLRLIERTGREIDAASAWYVRSLVVTTPTTGNRIHVFRTFQDARNHAAKSRGTLLRGQARPFGRAEDNSTTVRRPARE